MFTNKLTPEQRLSKAVVDIMGNPKYVALAGILMIGERKVCPVKTAKMQTACTNGRDEWYHPDFIDSISDAELRGLVLHENYHKLYKHLTTWKHLYDQDSSRANKANDYVINIKIADDNTDDFAKLPEGALLDPQYRGMDSAQVFNLLPEQPPEGGDGEGSDGGEGTGIDEHDWDGAAELSAEEQRELARELDEAIRQGAMAAGKLGTGGARELEELLQPQVNWRDALRDFITATCSGTDYSTWSKPNRRYRAHGIYMPSGISETVDELVIAVDTSGSIGQREVTVALSEIASICDTVKPKRVRLLYWDTRICGAEVYDEQDIPNLVKSTKPVGGGGTDVTCVCTYMTDNNLKPDAVVVITDGYLFGGWGTWSCPLMWVMIDNKSAQPDYGKVARVNARDM